MFKNEPLFKEEGIIKVAFNIQVASQFLFFGEYFLFVFFIFILTIPRVDKLK